jgi:hypothetical protein
MKGDESPMIDLFKMWTRLDACSKRLSLYFRRPLQNVPLPVPESPVADRKNREFYNSETYADLPDSLFHDFRIWKDLTALLPDDYVIPNPESMRILLPKTAGFYNSLFLPSSAYPDVLIDDQVWRRIKEALPPEYKIPDLFYKF